MSDKVDKVKDKGKSKSKASTQSVEWDSNKSSTHCVLCRTLFGTFTNRRHHCRNCGRLVCESCSANRFKIGGENSDEPAKRVCDDCFGMLRQKREMKLQVVQIKDKNLELMLSTSYISDSLINLFYLDGSTKTVGIDDTTTISDLAHLACPVMKLALFEVMQNIQAASQYKLLLPNQNVVALLESWQTGGQPYTKVVIPLANASCTPFAVAPQSTDQYDSDFRQSFRASMVSTAASTVATAPAATPFTPSPTAKSIYKVKQSPGVTSPIYLAAPSELMGTSYDSTRSEVARSPPASPLRRQRSDGATAGDTSTSPLPTGRKMTDDASTVSSSYTDLHQTGTGGIAAGGAFAGGAGPLNPHASNLAAELVSSQVQVHSLQAEVAALKADLKKAQQKYDVLRAVCFKSGQLDATRLQRLESGQSPTLQPGTAQPSLAQPRYGSGDSNTNFAALTSVGSGISAAPMERKLSKRSSFSWSTSQKVSATPSADRKAVGNSLVDDGPEVGRNDDVADREPVLNDRSAFSLARKPLQPVRSSIVGSSSSQQFPDPSTSPVGGNRNRANSALTADTDLVSDRPSSRNGSPYPTRGADADIFSEPDAGLSHTTGASPGQGSGTVTDKLHQEARSVQLMHEVLADPSRILALNRSALNLLVRTFFCKVSDIEDFCNRYCRLFDSVLHTNIVTHNNTALHSDALDDAGFSGDHSAPDPKLIIHVYHMIAAMDGVYEFISEYHEDWRSGLRNWLLRAFDECVQLPVVRTEDLRCCVYCLQRENMILSPEVLEIIQGSLDNSMHGRNTLQPTAGNRYRFTADGSDDGGSGLGEANPAAAVEMDIVGRGQEGQYIITVYNGSVYVQTLENIITTYYSVIGDLLPTLPVEIDVFAVFQMKLVNIVKNYVRAVYYAHKQAIAPGELIRLVAFYDKLAQFCEKFTKTTSPQLIKNIADMRPEVLRQCNTALVANLSEQMLKLFNSDEPAMSADMDMADKRRGDGSLDGLDSPTSTSTTALLTVLSGSTLCLGAGVGAAGSLDGLDRHGSSSSLTGLARPGSQTDLSAGASGSAVTTPSSGISRCSTLWPVKLVGLMRQHLGWIPAEMDVQKKVYWSVLLLDTLQEFHVKQSNWLTQSMKANTINLGPLVKYVNNHTKFALLLNDYIEEFAAELSDKHAAALFEKAEHTCGLFMENCSTGVENIATLLYVEVKDILKANLFRNGWDNSMRCVTLLRASLHRQFTFLQQHLSSGLSSSDSGGLEAVQQLLVYVCECLVSLYLELLLTNTAISMTVTTISRLSEDLELITKLFEELRNKIYLARMNVGRAPHIIETTTPKAARKNKVLSLGLKPRLLGRKKADTSTAAPAVAGADSKGPSPTRTASVPEDEGSVQLATMDEESKATFKQILQPLKHVVLAVQMNNQYLPDFVKSELYQDFGLSALNIWQLIMYWRKETKEDICMAYDKLFQSWRPPTQEESQLDIAGYIAKVKPANVVK